MYLGFVFKFVLFAETFPSYATAMLDLHNSLRARHGAPEMNLTSDLMTAAQR